MTRRLVPTALALFLAAGSGLAAKDARHDHGGEEKNPVKTEPLEGRVIDVACYAIEHGTGPEHKGCVLGGVPIAVLDRDGHLWVAISKEFGSARDLLLPHLGRHVRIEGWRAAKGEARVVSVSSITPLDKAPKKTSDNEEKSKEGS